MRANLELTRGLLMSESVTTLLAEPLGAVRAREVVEAAAERVLAEGGDLLDVLGGHDEVRGAVDPRELERALSPESYLGAADQLIERALAAHRRRERS
jgi:3-carboxy-cis,cis-muconate cycloisomerase